MAKAQFTFTKKANSFIVHIPNLESLSVEEIKIIEFFVKHRRGMFNFTNYTFEIMKRIEFIEFVSLIQSSGIDAICTENIVYALSDEKIDFGKYKGMQFSEIPDAYLKWLKINYFGIHRNLIAEELLNRQL